MPWVAFPQRMPKETAMTIRRVLWVAIPLLLIVVLVGGGALAWLLLRSPLVEPARLVVIGADTKVRLLEADGTERLLVDNAKTDGYSFPAVSTDGRRIAFVSADDQGTAIIVLDVAGGARKEVYRSRQNSPIDLAWSPDDKYLVFLIGSQLTAQIVPVDGSKPAQLISAGSPSFFAWSPDGTRLVLHLGGHTVDGGHVALFQPGQDKASPVLSDPGLFQAPAWSIDGQHVFYVAQPLITSEQPTLDDIKSDIVRVSAEGNDPTTLVREEKSDLRIVRAPDSDQIAYMVVDLQAQAFGPLKLIGGDGGTARMLSREGEHVTAFFWSPDGKQIAYLTYEGRFNRQGMRTWHVVETASGTVRDLGAFQPSSAFVGLQDFFDAYTFSFSPWSPASNQLAYGAEDGVYVLDLGTGAAAKKSDGALGMWVGGK
jgi:TolB protein